MWSLTLINGVAYGSLLFLLGAGFSMIFGVLKVINLAHGSFYLFGGYVTLTVYTATGEFVPALIAGLVVGGAFGVACERGVLYALQGQYLPQVLVTMGLLLILSDVAQIIWGGAPVILTLPGSLQGVVGIGALTYPVYRMILIGVGAAIAIVLWWSMERTTTGAMIRAAVDDEETAQAVGISVPRLRLAVFGIGGLLAGLSGGLGMSFIGARPGLDLEVFLLALVIVVVGGIGNLLGAYFAAIFVGLIDSVGKVVLPEASLFLLFVPMALFLVFRPTGLSGRPLNVVPPTERARGASELLAGLGRLMASLATRADRIPAPLWVAAVMAVLVMWPWLVSGYFAKLAALALIWSIFAMGLNVVLGYAGMPSLGHAAFFGAGAYAVALASRHLPWDGWTLLVTAVLCAIALAAVLGMIALRTRLVYFLLATVALAQVLWGIAFKWRSVTGGDDGLQNAQTIAWVEGLAPNVAGELYYVALAGFVVATAVMLLVHRSRFRLVLTGLRENEARLEALGYDVWRYKLAAFVLSGAYGGLAGGLFAFYNGFVSPELLGVVTSAEVLLMVILGGAGTFVGPILGAFALVGLEEMLSGWTEHWQILEGVLFVLVVLVARRGLVGGFQRLARRGYHKSMATP